jgi:hypothetical protein
MHVNTIWFQVWNLQQIIFFFTKNHIQMGWIAHFKGLGLCFLPLPPFPHSSLFNWPLWGLKFHFLGGRERS